MSFKVHALCNIYHKHTLTGHVLEIILKGYSILNKPWQFFLSGLF